MTCDPKTTLFVLDEPSRPKERRIPVAAKVTRTPPQLHLPVFEGEDRELAAMEEFSVAHRPLTRADCQGEARPCPWVLCKWHLYNQRFEEFAAVLDLVPEVDGDRIERRPKRPVCATEVVGKHNPRDRLEPDDVIVVPINADLSEIWPTCALDIADEVGLRGDWLTQEDVAALLSITREGVRQIQQRAAGFAAADKGLRVYLEGMVSSEAIDQALDRGIEWYGEP